MDRIKSILKTLSYWLAFVVAMLLGFGAIYRLTEKGGLGSVTGWVFAGITLLLLIFLLKPIGRFLLNFKNRDWKNYFIHILLILKKMGLWVVHALVVCTLPFLLYFVLKYFNLSVLVATRITIVLVFYFLGGYFLRKHGWSKALGIILFLTAIVLNLTFVNPKYVTNEFKTTIVFSLFPLLASIFLIFWQGKFLRVLGALVIIFIVPSTFYMAVSSYSSSTLITGQDRTIILASVEPLVDDMFQAWDDKDYQEFSKGFSDELKGNFSQDKFLFSRNELGKLISTDELRKVAPKSDSPLVAVETRSIVKFTKVMYEGAFEKYPDAIHGIIVDFKKSYKDNTYSIVGFTLSSFEGANTDSKALLKALDYK
ncbi:MAG: hypothetical protein Q7U36_01535 [bacterium]|nr:hypothetical protein [bacterium]